MIMIMTMRNLKENSYSFPDCELLYLHSQDGKGSLDPKYNQKMLKSKIVKMKVMQLKKLVEQYYFVIMKQMRRSSDKNVLQMVLGMIKMKMKLNNFMIDDNGHNENKKCRKIRDFKKLKS